MASDFNIPLEEGVILHCTRFPAQSAPVGLIIIAHGYKGFKDWGMFPYVADQLSQTNEVITFNFSHNGIGEDPLEFTELEKFAVNTYQRELSDLNALIDYLLKEEVLRNLPLYLLGHSRGAAVCLVHTLDHPDTVSGVISWNGITDLDLFTAQQKDEMRKNGRSFAQNGRTGQQMPLDVAILDDLEHHKERYDILERLTKVSFPIVLIQGTKDEVRFREGSSKLVELRPDIAWAQIDGGNHTFNTVHPFQGTTPQLEEAIQASISFIRDSLVAPNETGHPQP